MQRGADQQKQGEASKAEGYLFAGEDNGRKRGSGKEGEGEKGHQGVTISLERVQEQEREPRNGCLSYQH